APVPTWCWVVAAPCDSEGTPFEARDVTATALPRSEFRRICGPRRALGRFGAPRNWFCLSLTICDSARRAESGPRAKSARRADSAPRAESARGVRQLAGTDHLVDIGDRCDHGAMTQPRSWREMYERIAEQ